MEGWPVTNRAPVRRDELNCFVAGPSAPSATIVFMHGLGDTGEAWLRELRTSFPGLRIVAPNAPVEPVTINGGMKMSSWFDLTVLDDSLLAEENDGCKGMEASVALVKQIVEREVALLNGDASRVVLGGFSQGAALAAQVGLSFPQALGGIIIVSGWAAQQRNLQFSDANKRTPILCLHGEYDPTVLPQFGRHLQQTLEAQKYDVRVKWHKTGHSLGPGMEDLKTFVQDVVLSKPNE